MYESKDVTLVEVKEGKLQGDTRQSALSTSYVAFQSVPYATPPIGNLRFKDPQPPRTWPGIRDCKTFQNTCCIQKIDLPRPRIIGTEDCLYLNIYVPHRLRNTTGIAVMVWIHGANYHYGSGQFHNAQPDYLMEKDIILVTVNYRLGALGFFGLNNREASGNQGMKDQVAALQWIKENIAAFGGDPNNITLFGCNKGAVCVHLLMLSPLSKDLFHKAILQSAVITRNWMVEFDFQIKCCLELARRLGNKSDDIPSIVAYLQGVPASDIINAQCDILSDENALVGVPIFGPSIDTFSERPFLPCPLIELYDNSNQKPLILGHTSLEFMRFLNGRTLLILKKFYSNIPLYATTFLSAEADDFEMQSLAAEVRRFYFPDQRLTSSSVKNVLKCYSGMLFNVPIRIVADNRRKYAEAPTYLYQFSYLGGHKIVDRNAYSYVVHMPETTQFDDVPYLLYLPYYRSGGMLPPPQGSQDSMMIDVMTSMWTQFAKTGNPNCTLRSGKNVGWIPATKDNFCYLDIDKSFRLLVVPADYNRVLHPGV